MIRLIEEPVAIPPNKDLSPDVDIDDFWIYENPTSDEINDLLKISKGIRILVKNNNYYAASAKYYTHYIMSIYLKSYTGIDNEKGYDSSFIIETAINSIYNAMANRDKEKESFKTLIPLYNKIKDCGLINNNTIITSDWGDSIFEGKNLKETLGDIND